MAEWWVLVWVSALAMQAMVVEEIIGEYNGAETIALQQLKCGEMHCKGVKYVGLLGACTHDRPSYVELCEAGQLACAVHM